MKFYIGIVLFLLSHIKLCSITTFNHVTDHPKNLPPILENFPIHMDCGLEIDQGRIKQLPDILVNPIFNSITFSGICTFPSILKLGTEKYSLKNSNQEPFQLIDIIVKKFYKAVNGVLDPAYKKTLANLPEKFLTFLPSIRHPHKQEISFACCSLDDTLMSCFCSNEAAMFVINFKRNRYYFFKSTRSKHQSWTFDLQKNKDHFLVALLSPETAQRFQLAFERQKNMPELSTFIYSYISNRLYNLPKIMIDLADLVAIDQLNYNDASLYIVYNQPSLSTC